MKIYPILNIKESSSGYNWTNTYLKEINSKILSLFDYVYLFNPDFFSCDLPTETINNITQVDISNLPFHGYYKANSKVHDVISNRDLEAGTLIVSYARGEGEIDNKDAINRKNPKNYTFQPFGGASYYITEFANNALTFTYTPKAQETYGLSYSFAFDRTPKRYYIKDNQVQTQIDHINNNEAGKGISFIAAENPLDTSTGYIVNQNRSQSPSSLGMNTTANPLMCMFMRKPILLGNYSYEEIVFDYTGKTSSKIAETNIAVYTINKKDSSKGPTVLGLWFQAW